MSGNRYYNTRTNDRLVLLKVLKKTKVSSLREIQKHFPASLGHISIMLGELVSIGAIAFQTVDGKSKGHYKKVIKIL